MANPSPETHADRLRRHQAALADFGLEAFRANDLDRLLHDAAAMVSRGLDVQLVKILELLPEKRELLLRAGVNWRPGVVGHVTLSAEASSPAGYALAHEEAVVSPDVSVETRFEISPLLLEHGVRSMVNVIIAGEGQAFGVLEVDARRQRDFDADDVAFLRNYANLLAAAVDRLRTHAKLSEALESRQALTLELQHRVKNILALVQSLAAQSTGGERTVKDFREAFLSRLHALAHAHGLLFGEQTEGATLGALVEQTMHAHRIGAPRSVEIEGEPVPVSPRQGLALGLILHELCTNAAKYGALAGPDGCVSIGWRVEDQGGRAEVLLSWKEHGGPPVTPPSRRGFGTRMIERSTAHDLNGWARLHYDPAGFWCEIGFPLEEDDG